MPNEDTINLLKECDAGCKMGIDSIEQILDKVENKKLYDIIVKYLNDHQKLQNKITDKLNEFGTFISFGVSKFKADVMVSVNND